MTARALAVLVAALAALALSGDAAPARTQLPPPEEGVLYAVNLDWGSDQPVAYSERLGHRPSVYVEFAGFPLTDTRWHDLEAVAAQVAGQRGRLLLTLEPHDGLDSVTSETAAAVAARMRELNDAGVDVYLRFAHEMNASWYPWGQQPLAYVEAYRTIADAVHRDAPRTAMMWAPNYGGGYPFVGGAFEAQPGSADFRALDTDGDGALTAADDPYAPYYPGDDVVDWVGLSLYHWGSQYPWGDNVVPEPGKFEAQLTGSYHGVGGDESAVPDFHERYHVEHGKPVAVVETAALYVPGAGGQDELAIKQAWWAQVLDPGIPSRLPGLGMIGWFEWRKHEVEVDAEVDWTATADPRIRAAFVDALPDWLRFAED